MSERVFDVVIVGSGAGGSAAAYRLAESGLSVVLIEKGTRLTADGSTLDVDKVVRQGMFRSRECWQDAAGRAIVPEEYFNLGGKTRWYGAALLRYSPAEFVADPCRQCLGWPIGYEDLAPLYAEAERLLGVRRFQCESDLLRIVERLAPRGWEAAPLPMALAADITEHPEEARHFDGFATIAALKGDAQTALLERVSGADNLCVVTGQAVVELIGDADAPQWITGVQLADGRCFRAEHVILAAGALHSPRLLQRYLDRTGLATRLTAYRHIGRNLKLHLLTAMLAVSPSRKTDLLRKTTMLTHPALPHSSVQPLGFDGELIASLVPGFVPRALARQIGARAYGFFLQTEDGSSPDNRVLDGDPLSADASRWPRLDYLDTRLVAALDEHRRLIRRLRRDLLRAGYAGIARRIPVAGTAHACGTLVTGTDPAASVVDAEGRVHGMQGLYVADGSILPRSSRVNPSLTIYAWALRVADGLLAAERAAAA